MFGGILRSLANVARMHTLHWLVTCVWLESVTRESLLRNNGCFSKNINCAFHEYNTLPSEWRVPLIVEINQFNILTLHNHNVRMETVLFFSRTDYKTAIVNTSGEEFCNPWWSVLLQWYCLERKREKFMECIYWCNCSSLFCLLFTQMLVFPWVPWISFEISEVCGSNYSFDF